MAAATEAEKTNENLTLLNSFVELTYLPKKKNVSLPGRLANLHYLNLL